MEDERIHAMHVYDENKNPTTTTRTRDEAHIYTNTRFDKVDNSSELFYWRKVKSKVENALNIFE